MARIERIRVYPIKGFDGIDLEATAILEGGTLTHDREFALFSGDDVVNGKQAPRIHEFETDFDPETASIEFVAPDGDRRTYDLASEDDREDASAFLGEWIDLDVTLERDTTLGFVDRQEMGPSVISTATLETVASWFDDLTVESVRRRMRANVEVSEVPPFWEDRFVGEDAPTFDADGITFEGVTPCARCVVPSRDPDTGEPLPEFRQRFIEKRSETFPDWADPDAFDHYYTLMLIARIPESSREKTLRVGDPVEIRD